MTDIYSQQRKNKRATVFLMLVFFVFVTLLGLSADVYLRGSFDAVRFPAATAAAAVFGTANMLASYFYGDGIILFSVGAVAPDFDNPTHKRLHNVVVEMCLAAGVPMPKIFIIPDAAPNAFATGRDEKNSVVAVTQGLLDVMTRDELSAVVAHELGHIKNRDILMMMVVSVLIGTVSLLSDWALRAWRYGGIRVRRSSREKGIHPLILLLIAVFIMLSPLLSRIIAMAVSRAREYQADVSSAEFTRNPLALATALEKISSSAVQLGSAHKGTAHLFICDPLNRKLNASEGFFADVLSTHPPIEKRIEILRKMAYAYDKFGKGRQNRGENA